MVFYASTHVQTTLGDPHNDRFSWHSIRMLWTANRSNQTQDAVLGLLMLTIPAARCYNIDSSLDYLTIRNMLRTYEDPNTAIKSTPD